MSKSLIKIAQVFVALCLLALLIHHAGLTTQAGRQALLENFVNANIAVLGLSILVGVIINMASSLKWWMLTQSQNMGAGYWRIFAYYLVGQFYNQVLPTSVGGDVVRSYELGKFTGRQADSLASVFVERYTGVLVLLVVAGAAVLAQFSRLNSGFIVASLIAFTAGLTLIGWLVFDLRAYRRIRNWLSQRTKQLERLFLKIDRLLASVAAYRESPTAIAWAFFNSLVFYFLAVVNVYVTALIFQADVHFIDVLLATPVIMLLMNLPISLGNLFLMEASYTAVLALMGYSPALGLSIAVTMRLKSLLDGLLGGVLHPFFVTSKHE